MLDRSGRSRAGVAGTTQQDAKENRKCEMACSSGQAARMERMPASVRACVNAGRGEYNAQRLRSQREIIRDVMLSAADCDTWLTLGELRALTKYGEASISAQLRHLRKLENGGYHVTKRHREDASPAHVGVDGRGDFIWEYRVEGASAAA